MLSEATVKTHVTRILTKLQLRDRVQVVVLGYERGLVGRHLLDAQAHVRDVEREQVELPPPRAELLHAEVRQRELRWPAFELCFLRGRRRQPDTLVGRRGARVGGDTVGLVEREVARNGDLLAVGHVEFQVGRRGRDVEVTVRVVVGDFLGQRLREGQDQPAFALAAVVGRELVELEWLHVAEVRLVGRGTFRAGVLAREPGIGDEFPAVADRQRTGRGGFEAVVRIGRRRGFGVGRRVRVEELFPPGARGVVVAPEAGRGALRRNGDLRGDPLTVGTAERKRRANFPQTDGRVEDEPHLGPGGQVPVLAGVQDDGGDLESRCVERALDVRRPGDGLAVGGFQSWPEGCFVGSAERGRFG